MTQIGNRIVYDKSTGNILYGPSYNCLGESSNALDGLRPAEIDFIDLPYGSTVISNAGTYHVDITKDKTVTPTEQMVIIDSTIQVQPTYDQLQQQLLQAQGVI